MVNTCITFINEHPATVTVELWIHASLWRSNIRLQ